MQTENPSEIRKGRIREITSKDQGTPEEIEKRQLKLYVCV